LPYLRTSDSNRLVQDFKEAARLSASVKALAAEAATADTRAASMADELGELAARASVLREEVELLEEALAEARRSLALAQWRRLQVCSITVTCSLTLTTYMPQTIRAACTTAGVNGHAWATVTVLLLCWQVVTTDVQRQLDAAVAREAWEDAEVLQQELTAVTDQLAAASRPYEFEPADALDILDRLQPQPDDTAPASVPHGEAEGPAADAPLEPAHEPVSTPSTAQQRATGSDTIDAHVDESSAEHQQPTEAAAAAAAEILAAGQSAGLVPSASRARLDEGYAADSDSSISVLKLSQSAADIVASMQPTSHEASRAASTAAAERDSEATAASSHEKEGMTCTAGQPAGSEQPAVEDAVTSDQHHEGVSQLAAVGRSSDSLSSHVPESQGQRDAHRSAERADAPGGAYPSVAADAADSRTESSADGLTPSVSRTYLEGYAADSDTSIGGRNRHAAHSISAGPPGSAEQTLHPVRAKAAAVIPIPEGEQLSTGVPEELPPPAPPLNMLDRHDSGNLADAEDELPGEQQSHHAATVGHVGTAEDSGHSTARTSDVVPGSDQPSAGTGDVHTEQAGMFAGLNLA